MTILAGIYGFFGSDPGFVSWITSRPGFDNPVRVLTIRSDPIRSGPIRVLLMPDELMSDATSKLHDALSCSHNNA